MVFQDEEVCESSSVVRSTAGGGKKKTAHFKKRGHPAFKVFFLVFALLTFISLFMACFSTVMLVVE